MRAIAAREALPTEVRWTLGASHGVSYVSWRTFALGTVMASPLSWFSSAIVAGWSDRRADRSAGRTRRVAQKAKSHFFSHEARTQRLCATRSDSDFDHRLEKNFTKNKNENARRYGTAQGASFLIGRSASS